jgi:hypothetical protein
LPLYADFENDLMRQLQPINEIGTGYAEDTYCPMMINGSAISEQIHMPGVWITKSPGFEVPE